MLHLKPVGRNNDYREGSVKIVNNFDKKGNCWPWFTIKGFRDLLNLLVDEGYGDYAFSIGYDSNCATTVPTDIVKFDDDTEYIMFQG